MNNKKSSCMSVIVKGFIGFITILVIAYVVFTQFGPKYQESQIPSTASAPVIEGCLATEQNLLGSWRYLDGQGFFEAFALEEGRFSSWLHDRPEIVGASWSLEGCELVIKSNSVAFNELRFEVVELSNKLLRLYNISDGSETVYVQPK